LQLLEGTWITLAYTDTKTVSRETIRQTLKKTRLMPLAKAGMVHSPEGKRGVCSRDGRYS
jgi:hypothetical protein